MAAKPKTLEVTPGSELNHILEFVDEGPVLLDRAGRHYRVERVERLNVIEAETVDDLRVGYDPEALREAIAATAGSWADIDGDELIDYIYRSRAEGSRALDDA